MAVGLLPFPLLAFTDANGLPLAGAKLFSYLAGTSTPAALYADALGTTALANPAIADASGRLRAYGLLNQAYKLNLLSSTDVQQPHYPVDNITIPAAAGLPELPSEVAFRAEAFAVPVQPGQARLTVPGFYPANVYVWDVKVLVEAVLGASQGLVSVSVGDSEAEGRWLSGGTLTAGEKATRHGGMPKFATATDLWVTAEGGVFDATGLLTITRYTLERSGAAGGSAVGSSYVQVFTALTTLTVLGTVHQLGTNALSLSIYDSAGFKATANTEHVHPTTFDVTVTFLDPFTGYLVLQR